MKTNLKMKQPSPYIHKNPFIQGKVVVCDGLIKGWVACAFSSVQPLVFVDDTAAIPIATDIPQPDIEKAIGIEAKGFIFRSSAATPSSIVSLYGVLTNNVYLVDQKTLEIPFWENNFFCQALNAEKIARHKNAVAIVCWDGTGSAMRRAKTLYDIAAFHRPAIIFCYIHEELGTNLWPPLINCNLPIVAIPYQQRDTYYEILSHYGINFNTVWISGQSLPSFKLASVISNVNTRFILDIDKDMTNTAQSLSRTYYGKPGRNLTKIIMRNIKSRTVSNSYLQKRYGGIIVRGAGPVNSKKPEKRKKESYNLAFIGTIQADKKLLALAKVIKHIQRIAKTIALKSPKEVFSLRLNIFGDVYSDTQISELAKEDVVFHPFTPVYSLSQKLEEMDCIITGFPLSDNGKKYPTDDHIAAEISDALVCGLPVLIPDTPAAHELKDIPGIFIFTEDTFLSQLVAALNQNQPISLPKDFTLEIACQAFAEAERIAAPATEIHAFLPEKQINEKKSSTPALVLLWKQHDAGIYGRRMEQIARAYKRRFPQRRVIILELYDNIQDSDEKRLSNLYDFFNEEGAKCRCLERKKSGTLIDGIWLQTLEYRGFNLREKVLSFLCNNLLLPDNTLFVIFPIVQDWRYFSDLLKPYNSIIDVVDNQLSWASDDQRRCFVMLQYYTMLRSASRVVFNNKKNAEYFQTLGFLNTVKDMKIIPNWYTAPYGIELNRGSLQGKEKHIFYSGNMNDRIDWDLLHDLARQPNIVLHIAGAAQQTAEELSRLLNHDNVIYHGVLQEKETLHILRFMDATIIPHLFDKVSSFMNPIKVGMYETMQLPVFCPEHLGIRGKYINNYKEPNDCIKKINQLLKDNKYSSSKDVSSVPNSAEEAYMTMLEDAHNELDSLNMRLSEDA